MKWRDWRIEYREVIARRQREVGDCTCEATGDPWPDDVDEDEHCPLHGIRESKIESQRDYWLGWASGVIGALIGAGLMGWLS